MMDSVYVSLTHKERELIADMAQFYLEGDLEIDEEIYLSIKDKMEKLL